MLAISRSFRKSLQGVLFKKWTESSNIVCEICSIIIVIIQWLIKSKKKKLICKCGENEVEYSQTKWKNFIYFKMNIY